MNDTTAGWARIGAAVAARIDELGYSRNQVVTDLGMDWRTLDKLIGGAGLKRRDRVVALVRYLGWRTDAFERLRQGLEPVDDTNGSGNSNSSDLRDLLGVGGQVVQDQLDEIKARLDALEGQGERGPDRTTTNTERKAASRKAGARKAAPANKAEAERRAAEALKKAQAAKRAAPGDFAYAASREDGQPDDDRPTGETVHRPSPPDDGPDPTSFND